VPLAETLRHSLPPPARSVALLGLLLNLEMSAYLPLVGTMAVGTPAISFLGSIGLDALGPHRLERKLT